MFKKKLFFLTIILMLVSCAMRSTTINILPKIALPQNDPSLMNIAISINGIDQRKNQILAKIVQNNQLVTLTASRDLRFLLQEVLEKQMIARGYVISSNGVANLKIIINDFHTEIFQGNMNYNISSKAEIMIIATAINGNKITKKYLANYSVKRCLPMTIKNITKTVNDSINDIIANMAKDVSIHNFIKQNIN